MSKEQVEELRKEPPQEPGFDAVMEDVFELNIRGIRTIGGMIRAPHKVYAAARTKHWHGYYYTPSVRAYISLLAIMLLLRVFWIGEDSHIVGQIKNGLQTAPEAYRTPAIQDIYVDSFLLSLPIAMLICTLMASVLLRTWGKDTNTVTRIRLYFLTVLPGLLLSIFLLIGLEAVPASLYRPLAFGSYIPVLCIDAFTAWRGGVMAQTPRGRIGKSLLFASTNLAAGLAATVSASAYSGFIIGFEIARTVQASGL